MPVLRPQRIHRDWPLLVLIVLQLAAIGGYLGAGLNGREGGTGWRRIDTAELRQRVESGRLSDHEALWYHVGRD